VETVETALYFPYIRVPQSLWFTKILLYWDSAATIVPSSLWDHFHQEYMTDLVRADLLKFVQPYEALGMPGADFQKEFLKMFSAHEPRIPGRKRWTQIHTEKIEWAIFHEFERKGLAKPRSEAEREFGWWKVEETTAAVYMAYLAGVISGRNEGFLPVTDSRRSLAVLAPAGSGLKDKLRELRFEAVRALPAPSQPVPVNDLRAFKERYRDDLRRLRVHLDGRLADLAAIDDDEIRQIKSKSVLQEIQDDTARLREQMKKRKWPKVVLVGLGGVMGAALTTAATVATGGTALVVGLGVGGGLVSGGVAANQLSEIVRAPRFDRHAPLVYAALSQSL
jgi:Family of unknown function (DUF6236)